MVRRYEVHDEDGPLRAFYTRQEVEKLMQPGWKIVVLPKPKKKTVKEFIIEFGEAKWKKQPKK